MTVLLISTILYAAILLALGAYFFGKVRTQNEFCIGARNLKPSEIGFFGQLSELGLFFMVLIPSYVYLNGTGGAWMIMGLFIGTLLSWYLMSYRLMRYSLKFKNVYSLPAYYGRRFGQRSEKLEMTAAVFSIISELCITALIVRILGGLLADIFSINQYILMAIIVLVVTAFVILGGFLAAGRMSIVSIVMIFAAFTAIFLVCFFLFKADDLIVAVMNSRVTGGVSKYLNLIYYKGKSITVSQIYNQLSWGIVIMGLPGLLSKYMTLDKARTAKHGGRTAFLFTLITLFLAVVAGVVLRAFMYPAILKKHNYFMLIPRTIKRLNSMSTVYKIAGGVVLAGLIAGLVIMMISRMIILSSVCYLEIVKPYILKKKRIKKNLLALRITMAVMAVIITLLSFINVDPFRFIEFMLMLTAVFFGPATFMSIYFRKMNKSGALAGMLSALFTTVIWEFLRVIPKGGELLTLRDYLGMNFVASAVVISVIFIIIVSCVTKKVAEDVKLSFDDVKNRIIT